MRGRIRGALVGLVAAGVLVGCASQPVPQEAEPGNVAASTPAPAPASSTPATAPRDVDALLGADQALAVPDDPVEAAAYLVSRLREPETARAATREILARSGIGIFLPDTGALAVLPADPSLVDAYLYDFEVPLLADSVARGSSTSLQPAVDLLVGLGWVAPDTTVAELEELLAAWVQAARANPTGPVSFAGLAVGELLAARAASQGEDASAGIRLDPVGFQVFLASLVSGLGHFAGTASVEPAVSLASVRMAPDGTWVPADDDVMCNEPPKEYDSGLLDKGVEEALKKLAEKILGESRTERWSQSLDAAKILNTAMARAALLNGLQITVTSDAKDTPHYRHSNFSGSGAEVFHFTATAMFKTELGGRLVDCGPLAGLRIPADKGIKGLRLQWSLSDQLQCTTGGNNCELLGRIGSGGGGGRTDANGESKLEVQTIVEKGCPDNTARCEKGKTKKVTAWAKVTPDLTNGPPIDLGDFWMAPAELPAETAKALIKVLEDVATDMVTAARPAKGTQTVEYHQVDDYRVDFTDRLTLSGVKCDGFEGPWSLAFSGHPGANTSVSGSMDFTLDENARGRATLHITITSTVPVGGQVITAKVDADGTGDIELLEPDGASMLELSNVKSKASGKASGTGGAWGKLFASGDEDGYTLPVARGSYCKG